MNATHVSGQWFCATCARNHGSTALSQIHADACCVLTPHSLTPRPTNGTKHVALLADKQDLEDLHAALCGYKLGDRVGDTLSWEAHERRCENLAARIKQVLAEAF